MIDKQIMIDGVDVSGCEYYNKDDKTCREVNGKYDTDICEFEKCENYNCCYKQLKRKEQEVQQAMDNYVQLDLQRVKEYNELVDLYKAKEQECEELHSRTASIIYSLTGGRLSYSTYSLEGCEDAYRDQLSIDVERATKELEGKNETLKQEVNTLEQALDEIESLCKNEACSPCKELEENYYCDECHNKIILDIINKAKGELTMTDEKEIIIDGIDVSGCKNLMQGLVPFGCMEDRKTCSCMNNPNCLYKQLNNKLEKTFFDTFGIEPKTIIEPRYSLNTEYYEEKIEKYPKITDHILLELILINMHHEDLFGYPNNIQELKDNTLKQLIETYNKFSTCVTYDGEYQQMAKDIKQQVRTLFEGDSNDR